MTVRALSMAVSLVALALFLGCGGSDEISRGTSVSRGGASADSSADLSALEEGLDLEAMVAPVPEYEGSGRNLFVYGPERRVAAPPRGEPRQPPPQTTPTPPRPSPPPRPTPTAAPTRVDVKYAGFLEKTEPDGAKAKYAIFFDGNEILAGAEGETIANRFKVVEIGLESVIVAAMGSEATQRIPLQSN